MDSLKKKIKSLEEELEEKRKEMNEIKRNIKFTKFQEYKIQLEIADKECKRLQKMLEELLLEKHEDNENPKIDQKGLSQMVIIKELRKKNNELTLELNNKIKENTNLLDKIQDPTEGTYNALKIRRQIESYKEKTNEMAIEIEELKFKLAKKNTEEILRIKESNKNLTKKNEENKKVLKSQQETIIKLKEKINLSNSI